MAGDRCAVAQEAILMDRLGGPVTKPHAFTAADGLPVRTVTASRNAHDIRASAVLIASIRQGQTVCAARLRGKTTLVQGRPEGRLRRPGAQIVDPPIEPELLSVGRR